jgi:hypothetical protein
MWNWYIEKCTKYKDIPDLINCHIIFRYVNEVIVLSPDVNVIVDIMIVAAGAKQHDYFLRCAYILYVHISEVTCKPIRTHVC